MSHDGELLDCNVCIPPFSNMHASLSIIRNSDQILLIHEALFELYSLITSGLHSQELELPNLLLDISNAASVQQGRTNRRRTVLPVRATAAQSRGLLLGDHARAISASTVT
jgi:hypothetical protein